jgi:hypothetical protein
VSDTGIVRIDPPGEKKGHVQYYDYQWRRAGRQVSEFKAAAEDEYRFVVEPAELVGSPLLTDATIINMGLWGSGAVFAPNKIFAYDTPHESQPHEALLSSPPQSQSEGVEEVAPALVDAVDQVIDIWFEAAAHQATMRRAAKHPAFELLRRTGCIAIERLVHHLRMDPNPLWVWALGELTEADPAEGMETIPEAVQAWLTWADERGLG